MSTLPPTPAYDPNIPIVTSAGGTTAVYKDPNSPESILKKVTEVKAQAAVDTKYDVAVNPYKEGFKNRYRRKSSSRSSLLTFLVLIIVILVISKTLKFAAKIFLIFLGIILLLVLIVLFASK